MYSDANLTAQTISRTPFHETAAFDDLGAAPNSRSVSSSTNPATIGCNRRLPPFDTVLQLAITRPVVVLSGAMTFGEGFEDESQGGLEGVWAVMRFAFRTGGGWFGQDSPEPGLPATLW